MYPIVFRTGAQSLPRLQTQGQNDEGTAQFAVRTELVIKGRYVVYNIPCVGCVWDAETKFKIKRFDETVTEVMSLDHPHVWHLRFADFEFQAAAQVINRLEKPKHASYLVEMFGRVNTSGLKVYRILRYVSGPGSARSK